MNKNKSGFAVMIFAVLFVGLALSIMQGLGVGQASLPLAAAVAPTRKLVLTAAALTPVLNITSTLAPPPKAELVHQLARPTKTAADTNFTFTDPVPAADSPEFEADSMNACFSAYTRAKNEAENSCIGEWYPADYAPRLGDTFWCAANSGRVGWVPVRFFDGRASETVRPYGSLNHCE